MTRLTSVEDYSQTYLCPGWHPDWPLSKFTSTLTVAENDSQTYLYRGWRPDLPLSRMTARLTSVEDDMTSKHSLSKILHPNIPLSSIWPSLQFSLSNTGFVPFEGSNFYHFFIITKACVKNLCCSCKKTPRTSFLFRYIFSVYIQLQLIYICSQNKFDIHTTV